MTASVLLNWMLHHTVIRGGPHTWGSQVPTFLRLLLLDRPTEFPLDDAGLSATSSESSGHYDFWRLLFLQSVATEVVTIP